jgi:methionyl aminopeptidase
MDEAKYAQYKRAGTIAADARDYGVTLIKPGARFLDVATAIETRIKQNGGGLAFPVNIALNTLAAHYSPRHDDQRMFKKGDIVKLDVGAHVNGYIADTAITIEIETHTYDTMIAASSEALRKAIQVIKAGTLLQKVGEVVEQTIINYRFKPINNLMGHGLERFQLHSGVSIPNVGSLGGKSTFKEGEVVAIEPFATNGAGHVVSGEGSNIYLCSESLKTKFIRDTRTKLMFEKMMTQFSTLPFAERWYHELFPSDGERALKKLSFLGLAKHYPQLLEAKGGVVTQKEHTVIVKNDGCEVIT